MRTDFEEFGLSQGRLGVEGRPWLLTVDFEAFQPAATGLWTHAMHAWANHARASGLRFTIFLAVEDVIRLRSADPAAFDAFTDAVRDLADAGADFHPHNHRVFDPETGAPTTASQAPRRRPAGYTKRLSLFHDVVNVNHRDLHAWMPTVRQAHERFLAEAGLPLPEQLAFRAGGWDYGSTADDLRAYVAALEGAGFAFDSSACVGRHGERGWRNGAPFGANVFRLTPRLVEVAATSHMNCGAGLISLPAARTCAGILREPRAWAPPARAGAFITVLHFDHLFHLGHRGSALRFFALDDPGAIVRRVHAHFRQLSLMRRVLRLRSATFAELDLSESAISEDDAVPARVG